MPSKPSSPRSRSPQDDGRERGRPLGIEGAEDDMRGHHDLGARFNAGGEGLQIDAPEVIALPRHGGQAAMTVEPGIAVAREVLERRDAAVLLQAAHGGGGHGATNSGFSPNERMPMIELCGLELQSAAGPSTTFKPTAPVSLAMTPYIS